MKTYIVGVIVLLMLSSLMSCDQKEKKALEQKVDSLNVQLEASREKDAKLNEVGMLIDSIDVNRKHLERNMVEGSGSYTDYVARLRDINDYVHRTEQKITQLEKSNQLSSNESKSSVRRMKRDLEKRSKEILDLQEQLALARNENRSLSQAVARKDSTLRVSEEVIASKENDVANLEKMINDTKIENKMTVANLYFAQAEALEDAASRTQFAARKKRETKQEAIELYKLSLSLGKTEAETKISELEK